MYLKPCKNTREASDYQEKRILHLLPPSFRQSINSGAGAVRKGDVYNCKFIIEAKTHTKEVSTHHAKYGDLQELSKHGLATGKNTAYVFDFGYGTPELYELTKVSQPLDATLCVTEAESSASARARHPWIRYATHSLSFNRGGMKATFVNTTIQFYAETAFGTYRIKLFDPRDYM